MSAPAVSGVHIQSGDVIQLTGWSIGGATWNATLDIVLDNGSGEQQIVMQQVATTDRTGKNTNLTVGFNGTIVSAGLTLGGGAKPGGPGEAFFQLNVFSGNNALSRQKVTLFGGYWYPGHTPTFPPGIIESSSAGPGRRYTATGINQAVNTEVADTVPAKAFWRLISIQVVFVTDANAANRLTNFFVDDAGSPAARAFVATDTTAQTATLTRTHAWYEGADTPTTASVAVTDGAVTLLAKYPTNLPLKYLLVPGSNLRTITTALQATDDYGTPQYVVEEWIQTQ